MWHESLGVLATNCDQFLWLLARLGARGDCSDSVLCGTILIAFCVREMLFGYLQVEGEGLSLGWVGSASGWSCMCSYTRVDVAVGSYDARYVQVLARVGSFSSRRKTVTHRGCCRANSAWLLGTEEPMMVRVSLLLGSMHGCVPLRGSTSVQLAKIELGHSLGDT